MVTYYFNLQTLKKQIYINLPSTLSSNKKKQQGTQNGNTREKEYRYPSILLNNTINLNQLTPIPHSLTKQITSLTLPSINMFLSFL